MVDICSPVQKTNLDLWQRGLLDLEPRSMLCLRRTFSKKNLGGDGGPTTSSGVIVGGGEGGPGRGGGEGGPGIEGGPVI